MPDARMDDAHLRWFEEYVRGFRRGAPEDDRRIDLKYEHSLKVYEESLRLIAALGLAGETAGRARLAALYHDVGRFPQYDRFKTFRDADSVNHAVLSVAVLRKNRVLESLPKAGRALIYGAIILHNRKNLPIAVERKGESALFAAARIVRDCDKLDILRIMLESEKSGEARDPVVTLGLSDDPSRYSREVAAAVAQGGMVDYRSMRTLNDLRLLLLSWSRGLYFRASRDAFFERGYAKTLLGALPDDEDIRAVRRFLFDDENPSGKNPDA